MKKYWGVFGIVCLVALVSIDVVYARAGEFGKIKINCKKNIVRGNLDIIPGAPKGDYSFILDPIGANSDLIFINGGTPGEEALVPFSIPQANSQGVNFDIGAGLNVLMELPGDTIVSLQARPGDDETLFTGFGTATGDVLLTREGCDDLNGGGPIGDPPVRLNRKDRRRFNRGLTDVEIPDGFLTIPISNLINNTGTEERVSLDISYKAPRLIVDGLGIDEDTTKEEILMIAERFRVRWRLKARLEELADAEAQEAREEAEANGEDGDAAEQNARQNGNANRMSRIVNLKFSGIDQDASRREQRRQRQEIRKRILDAADAEIVEFEDGQDEDGEDAKCITVRVSLPLDICPADENGDNDALIAQAIQDELAPGEELSLDIPFQMLGNHRLWFGKELTIRLTVVNDLEQAE